MARLIKRYGSRKLYDTTESRYVLLEDIAEWVREGQEIEVVDNKTGEDVTAATLAQVIAHKGQNKSLFLSSESLHDIIRAGETAVNARVRQVQEGMDRLVKRGLDRFLPMSAVRAEMESLRARLDELETAVETAEREAETKDEKVAEPAEAPKKPAAKTTRKPAAKKTTTARKTTTAKKTTTARKTTTAKKTTAAKPAAKKTTTRKPAAKKPAAAKPSPAPVAATKAATESKPAESGNQSATA